MSWYAYWVVQKSSKPSLLSRGTESLNLPNERLDCKRVAKVVKLSRSSDVKGLDACSAKNEVSRRDVMAQLYSKSRHPSR